MIGNASSFKLSVDPNSPNVHGAAAAFVLYGLTMGFESYKAARTYLGLVVLLKAAMEGQRDKIKIAPRLFWQVCNALAPKEANYKRQTIKFDWNMANFSVNNVPNIGGVTFGVPLNTDQDGLYKLDVSAVTVPTVEEASDYASELWSLYPPAHKPIERVDDYIRDVSAFAYKVPVISPQATDTFTTQYGINALEVPISSWFGFCGFGLSTAEAIPIRVPRFFRATQGSALQYIGSRLHYPMLLNRKHNLTRINFRTLNMEEIIIKAARSLGDVREKLEAAGRPQTQPYETPDAYSGKFGTDATHPVIDINLFAIHRLLNVLSAIACLSGTWAGVFANGLSSMATGTCLILPDMNAAYSDCAWMIEVMRQMHPVFASHNDMLHVPVPCISDDFIPFFRAGFGAYFDSTGATMPTYGGNNLDLLNGQIGSQAVQLMNGPSLSTNRTALNEADGFYSNMLSLQLAVPEIAPLRSYNIVRTRLLNSSFERNVDQLMRFFAHVRSDKARIKKFIEWYTDKERLMKIRAPFRTSPLVSGLPVVGDTAAMEIQSNGADNQLAIPVALYESPTVALHNQRLVSEDTESMIIPNNVSNGYGIQQLGISSNYSGDPNNEKPTEVMALAVTEVTPEQIIDKLDPLVDLLPPRIRTVAKLTQKVVKAAVPAIQAAVQRGKERRAKRKNKQ